MLLQVALLLSMLIQLGTAINLPIHDGSILGFPGKLLAFFASFIAASLPVTGFILWLKRRKRRRSLIKMIDVN
ncbi:PepSY domain-containing protein [Maribellus maritimus]|uniref:PepSY domain-containing protein n=1 Tax=Maribellus maritimus TaxID=2870838 RepID=UPI001EECAFCC|nr:PepSY domain-containing protein [Maribellus maritimus]MCG6191036.1 PepSY domain-containing protein [Maribellus maritimus]